MKPIVAVLTALSVAAIVLALSQGALDRNTPRPNLPGPDLLVPPSPDSR